MKAEPITDLTTIATVIGPRGGMLMKAKPITLLPRILLLGAQGRVAPSLREKLEKHNFFLLVAMEVDESHSQKDKTNQHKKVWQV